MAERFYGRQGDRVRPVSELNLKGFIRTAVAAFAHGRRSGDRRLHIPQDFSETVYLRQNTDVRLAVRDGRFESGRQHHALFGRAEGRPSTYRRLRPGQAASFVLPGHAPAASGVRLFLAVEAANPTDRFTLALSQGGQLLRQIDVPFGELAVVTATGLFTDEFALADGPVEVGLAVAVDAENDLFLVTRDPGGRTDLPAEAALFWDRADPDLPRGMSLSFSPVSQCNQACPHCISKFSRDRFTVASQAVQDQILALAATGRVDHITADYSGDPFFTNQRYFPLFAFLCRTGVPFRLDTNGAYVDAAGLAELVDSRLSAINFSLDAATPATHRRLRGGRVGFGAICDNINLAVRTLAEAGRSDVATSCSFTLMRSNLDEASAFVDLCRDLGVGAVHFGHVHVYQAATATERLATMPEAWNAQHDELWAKLSASGLPFDMPPPFYPELETSGRRRCSAPWSGSMQVLATGAVQACCVPGTTVGQLDGQSLDEIWTSDRFMAFRKRAGSRTGDLCGRCAFVCHSNVSPALG